MYCARALIVVGVVACSLVGSVRSDEPAWKVGDKVDAWNVAWYPGVIKEIGIEKYQGYYLIKWDEYSIDQWVEAKNIRARKAAAPAAPVKTWKVGDEVEAWSASWYAGSIKEIGADKYKGYYLVKWAEFDSEQWVDGKNIRAPRDVEAEAKKAASLTLAMGKYQCAVFLNGKYTPVSTFTLNKDGSYQSSRGKGGKYRYDAAGKRITFSGGALEDFVGRVEAELEHDRLIVRLNQEKDLEESEYTQNWRALYCTPVK